MGKKIVAFSILSIIVAGGIIGGIFIFGNDSSAPFVRIRNPIHSQMYTSTDLLLKIDAWEDFGGKIDSVWYSWEEGINVTYTGEEVVEFSEGEITLHAWANDTKGNLGSTTISFVIDTSLPSITILSPTAGVHGSQSQLLEISASDFGEGELDSVWYNWDGVNVTYLMPIEVAFEEREIVLTAWTNDTAGNEASASVIFTIDSDYPDITIVSPLSTRYSSASHTLEITATDNYGVDEIWFSWKGPTTGSGGTGDVNITYGGPEAIVFDKGVNIVKVWANDTHGNVALEKLIVVIQGNNFSSVWDTTKTSSGSSDSNQVRLPLISSGRYDCIVDWGDGSSDIITEWNQAEATHTYCSSGIYTINITGILIGWRFNNGGDKLKILDIKHWGDLLPNNDTGHFYGCQNLIVSATDVLILDQTNSLESTFRGCQLIDSIERIHEWDTSSILNMNSMFLNALIFNQSLNGWEVSHVVSMRYTFSGADDFNQDLDQWITSSVTDMTSMFHGAESFNGNISNWDVSRVITMQNMFTSALNFNSSINSWNVCNVKNMLSMFDGARHFNQSIGDWDVSNVIHMSYMFSGAYDFNQNLSKWDVSNVENMGLMFNYATSFNQSLSAWNVSKVTDMSYMFCHAVKFNQDLGSWNVSSVEVMNHMFDAIILSTEYYDNMLISWAQLSLHSGVTLDAGFSKYSAGAAASARAYIISTFSWTINDDGQV